MKFHSSMFTAMFFAAVMLMGKNTLAETFNGAGNVLCPEIESTEECLSTMCNFSDSCEVSSLDTPGSGGCSTSLNGTEVCDYTCSLQATIVNSDCEMTCVDECTFEADTAGAGTTPPSSSLCRRHVAIGSVLLVAVNLI